MAQDLESLQAAIRRCVDNAEALLDSAKILQNKNRNHISYHLAALAMEEIGKAALFLVKSVKRTPTDHDDDSEIELTDHRKKIFWALFTPSMDAGRNSIEEFHTLQALATEIHNRRLGTLYADVESDAEQISNDDLARLIRLTQSRLNMEQLKKLRELDASEQKILDWFLQASDDKQVQMFVLSEQSRSKLLEFSGDSRKWMAWLHEQVSVAEAKARELMEQELRRSEPTGQHANKPKWKIKIRLNSLSHTIRPKQLNEWNQGVQWLKLFPVGNYKHQLLLEITIPAKVLLGNLWLSGLQFASMFVTALNIASIGFFWWYLPEFADTFYEEIIDLESNSKLKAEQGQTIKEGWKARRALKSNELVRAGTILGHFVRASQEQSNVYALYARGIALMAKNDVFSDFSSQAFVHFASSLRAALAAYGDWDGKSETFDQSMKATMEEFWKHKPDAVEELLRLVKLADDLRNNMQSVPQDEALKMKAFCDAYLNSRALREAQKAIQERRESHSSSEQAETPPS